MAKMLMFCVVIISSYLTVSCTCSREKEKKELATWPQCSEAEQQAGTCGEKKTQAPRTLKLKPEHFHINRELLNRAFNEQVRGEKPAANPQPVQKPASGETPSENTEKSPDQRKPGVFTPSVKTKLSPGRTAISPLRTPITGTTQQNAPASQQGGSR